MPVAKFFVSANFEVRKKALDRFFESDSMLRKLVALEIIFEIFRGESAPIDHTPLYYASSRETWSYVRHRFPPRRTGVAQTATCCSLRSGKGPHFELIQIGSVRNAGTEPRVCASLVCGNVDIKSPAVRQ